MGCVRDLALCKLHNESPCRGEGARTRRNDKVRLVRCQTNQPTEVHFKSTNPQKLQLNANVMMQYNTMQYNTRVAAGSAFVRSFRTPTAWCSLTHSQTERGQRVKQSARRQGNGETAQDPHAAAAQSAHQAPRGAHIPIRVSEVPDITSWWAQHRGAKRF